MTEWSSDLVLYRMTRANETLENGGLTTKRPKHDGSVGKAFCC